MTKPLISSALMTLTMLTLVGCHATPALAPMPFAPALQSSVQSATTTVFTDIDLLDPSHDRARKSVNDYFRSHPLKLRMRLSGPPSQQNPAEQEQTVRSAHFTKLAARTLPGGATEFVTVATLEGGYVPVSFSEYYVTRTLRFTVNAQNKVTAFKHLDPSAIKDFTIVATPSKP
jgi:hypothetical protein